ncbi:MAG: hypothetical protein A2351_01480 [Omnitrophica bacterium RIFOXYB12_FULL_50_7]|nr:MAG: hypothetical protein A2351_01480 [Omnitrophica bacterium RIFOXYB12_FULL_50_7]
MFGTMRADKKMQWLVLLCGLVLLASCKGKDPSWMSVQQKAEDTLILKNGSMVQGVIVEENKDRVTIRIKGGEIGFPLADVAQVRRGEKLVKTADGIQSAYAPSEKDAPYPRVYLKDGRVASGSQISKEGGTFYLKQALKEGGNISFGFDTDKVEKVELWPPPSDDHLNKDFKQLRGLNLKYSFKKPPYYVVSTVESSDLVLYFKTLQQFYADFSMRFLEFIDTEKPAPALGVVIFGDYNDFLKYAGLPKGTNMAGFYMPDKKYLVLFNVKEIDRVRFFVARAEYIEKSIGDVKTRAELYSGTASAGKWAYYDFVEKIQFKFEADRVRLEGWARDRTMETLRHEAGHQLFDLLGIDSGGVYRGAWLSEGLAEYVSTDPIGGINHERLTFLKEELEAGHHLMPLQYLMSIPNGAGIRKLQDPTYTLLGYAQSWGLVHFLMERYSKQFSGYIRAVMSVGKDYNAQKDSALLEKHVGKSVKELDAEYEKYIRNIVAAMRDSVEDEIRRLLQKA